MYNVILCGGVGERLWPLSREEMPKQFLKLFGKHSLFQRVALGNHSFCKGVIVVCHARHERIVIDQLAEINITPLLLILEPVVRNTAASIALAALSVDSGTLLLITPADQYVTYDQCYAEAIRQAVKETSHHDIVLFGINPKAPETGYGYIEVAGGKINRFHEKPSLERAKQYIANDGFYWNSGMLCARSEALLGELEKHAPLIAAKAVKAVEHTPKVGNSPTYLKIPLEEMQAIPESSFDYSVLEKCSHLKLVPCSFKWSDLGCFDSLYQHLNKDDFGNAVHEGHCLFYHSNNNLVVGGKRVIVAVDIEDCVIIDTDDFLLVAKRGYTQDVKQAVHDLRPDIPKS